MALIVPLRLGERQEVGPRYVGTSLESLTRIRLDERREVSVGVRIGHLSPLHQVEESRIPEAGMAWLTQ